MYFSLYLLHDLLPFSHGSLNFRRVFLSRISRADRQERLSVSKAELVYPILVTRATCSTPLVQDSRRSTSPDFGCKRDFHARALFAQAKSERRWNLPEVSHGERSIATWQPPRPNSRECLGGEMLFVWFRGNRTRGDSATYF